MRLLSFNRGAIHGYCYKKWPALIPWNKGKLLGQKPPLKLKELWETQHAAMQRALERHDAILRDTIAANDGHLVETTGDGALAAFAIAAEAVAPLLAVSH